MIANRWSPRSFDVSVDVPEDRIRAFLEAARWTASASNTQPWRFIVGRRGGLTHSTIVENLMGFNKAWAGSASVLLVNLAETTTSEGVEQRWAHYDLGQAAATLALQAHKDGFHVHQMGGIEVNEMRRAFNIDDRFDIVSVSAVGVLAAPEALPNATLRERESAPRVRLPLDDLVLLNN